MYPYQWHFAIAGSTEMLGSRGAARGVSKPSATQMLVLHLPRSVSLHDHVRAPTFPGSRPTVDDAGPEEAIPAHGVVGGQDNPLEISDLVRLVTNRLECSLDRPRDLIQAPMGPVGEPVNGVLSDQRHDPVDLVTVVRLLIPPKEGCELGSRIGHGAVEA